MVRGAEAEIEPSIRIASKWASARFQHVVVSNDHGAGATAHF
jgi:hypothetical protein